MAELSETGVPKRVMTLRHPAAAALVLGLVAAYLTSHLLTGAISPALLWQATWYPDDNDMLQLIVHYSLLPRIAISICGGAALGLSGCLMQHVLRNPLAEPATLGLSAGAYLAVTAAGIWMPSLFIVWREGIALLGASIATLIVFGISWRRALTPLALIMAGLVVTLYANALTTGMLLLHDRQFEALSLWGSGSLIQKDWTPTLHLTLAVSVAGLCLPWLVRPLTLLGLGDAAAQSLGISVTYTRLVALGLATILTACVVSMVGVIGFVGLAAPLFARLLGKSQFSQRLLWSAIIGALLLWATDQVLMAGSSLWGDIPTGAVTALLGAPLLLWASRKLRSSALATQSGTPATPIRLSPPVLLILLALALLLCLGVALDFGRQSLGWYWASFDELSRLFALRAPRTFGACAAGALLATAGAMMQRLTGNPMASPELLGVSTGASFALVIALFAGLAGSTSGLISSAAGGATLVSLLLLGGGWRGHFDPDRLALWGIALGALLSALMTVLLASGDPRSRLILNWISGSTYQITATEAGLAASMAVVLFALSPVLFRWLDILPLGTETARSLGVGLRGSRLAVLVFTATATAVATVVVGPLSFVGLMGPHMVRLLGLRRPAVEVAGSALLGALLMVVADLIGRNALFPYQMPAGLVATLVGGPYFIWLIISQRKSG